MKARHPGGLATLLCTTTGARWGQIDLHVVRFSRPAILLRALRNGAIASLVQAGGVRPVAPKTRSGRCDAKTWLGTMRWRMDPARPGYAVCFVTRGSDADCGSLDTTTCAVIYWTYQPENLYVRAAARVGAIAQLNAWWREHRDRLALTSRPGAAARLSLVRTTDRGSIVIAARDSLDHRIAGLDWDDLLARLDADGFVLTPPVYTPAECAELGALFDDGSFRSTIDMRRYRFGEGRYRYFSDPLPALIDDAAPRPLPRARPPANRWAEQLRSDVRYPAELDGFLEQCHRAGQTRPTPLILRYGPGGHTAAPGPVRRPGVPDPGGDRARPPQARTSAAASSS